VLEEETSNHFDLNYSSPFMLETCAVTSAFGLPAITHVDGSARVQTVNQEDSPRYYKLIKKFAERTGCPILLNTSFNVRGEPIVCSPLEALMCFLRSDMDCLVLEDLVIDRCNVPNEWLEWFKDSQPVRLAGIKHTNYTLL
jgi:carbamoyltransferase